MINQSRLFQAKPIKKKRKYKYSKEIYIKERKIYIRTIKDEV